MINKCNNQILNSIISTYRQFKYQIIEPHTLRKARRLYARNYINCEKEPLISVYVPTYNRCELLMERAVDSVLKQSYSNFEFIIVGDHCTDNTEKFISAIKDHRIRFYNISSRGYRYPPTAENHWFAGPVIAANTALEMVEGKWIARIDDDDIWTHDHLEKLLETAIEHNLEFISGSHLTYREGIQEIVNPRYLDPPIGGTQTWLYRKYLKFFKYNIDCWRKKYNRVNDMDLQDRMYRAGVKTGYIEDVVCKIIPRPGENQVGLKAYKINASEICKNFKFHD